MRTLCSRPFAVASLAIGALTLSALQTQGADFTQTNLVSTISALGAKITDPQLVNPWGVAHSPTSPVWSSNNGGAGQNPTGSATLYNVTDKTTVSKVNINPPTGFVAIPTTGSGPQGPTGTVNNTNTSSFPVLGGDGKFAHFIFANLNGTISAWDPGSPTSSPGSTAIVQTTGAANTRYTGLAINRAQTRLYAANHGLGRIDVFDSKFAAVTVLGANAFVDPSLPTQDPPLCRSTCSKSTARSTWSMHPRGLIRSPQTLP
jgi:uncharacterized protein (TIGR03118 family)